MKTIGIIHSCFREKFGIPRQAGLVPEARAVLEVLPPFNQEEAFIGLEQFSHIWIVFVFHSAVMKKWKATVRPPRLGGNRRIGVFATRSNFRPNPIGLSVVELEGIEKRKGSVSLHLKGVDFLDQTPVLDIKPYLSYADHVADARCGFAPEAPCPALKVEFSPAVQAFCREQQLCGFPHLQQLITQILQNDPRPAYFDTRKSERRTFGMHIYDFNVQWKIQGKNIIVTDISNIESAD